MSEILKNCELNSTSVLLPSDLDDIYSDIATLSNQISALPIVTDKYVTKFEVFATSVDIPAGYISDAKVNFNAMFSNTNQWHKSISYDRDQVVIHKRIANVVSSSQIYKAVQDVPRQTDLTASEYWKNITEDYIGLSDDQKFYHKYINTISAQTVQLIELRSSHAIELQNVEIDWGDGTKTYLKDAIKVQADDKLEMLADISSSTDDKNYALYSSENSDYEISYIVQHNYLPNMSKDKQKFIITITGSTYWGIGYQELMSNVLNLTRRNIISRIWDIDLPFYDGCKNTACMMLANDRLLYINLLDCSSAVFYIYNTYKMFAECKNLQYVNGFKDNTWYNMARAFQNMFYNCSNLVKCDIRFPHSMPLWSTPINGMYYGCKNLTIDVTQILPINGFSSRIITFTDVFSNCISLQISDSEKYNQCSSVLWNDNSKEWKHISNVFSTCNSRLREKVPTNWGGTANQ